MSDRYEKWSDAKLAYTAEQRRKIMACIQRLNTRESAALNAAMMDTVHGRLPRPFLRDQIRDWFRQRWLYLIREYEKILPHVDNLK